MKTQLSLCEGCRAVLCFTVAISGAGASAGTVTWDNSAGDNKWSTATNWDTQIEPLSTDEVVLPAGLAATLTLATGEKAKTLQFADSYTLTGGGLTLTSASTIEVAGGKTASINTPLTVAGGTTKSGDGVLALNGSNTFAGGLSIQAGTLRIGHANAIGAAANSASVGSGSTLEIADDIAFARAIALDNGATLASAGTASSSGAVSIGAAATSVTLGTSAAADILTLSSGIAGGSAATVIDLAGTGAVRLTAASPFDGTWNIPTGRLELGHAGALGDTATSAVTLSGGSLSARANSATNFTASPANKIVVGSNSGLISDRSSAGAGLTHTFGTLAIGSQVLSVTPGTLATSGTAGIALGDLTLTGDPTFAVNDLGSANGKLTTGTLLGGGVARAITKVGAGDLAVSGGVTDLPAGSQFSATGGGTVEMLFPNLGSAASVAITPAQNPFGEASISITDGSLRLLADGSGTTAVQTYALPAAITLGGTVALDPDRRSGSNANKTFELPGLTLAPNTDLAIAGDYTHGLRLSGAMTLQGNATLRGSASAGKDGLLALDGGIEGSPSHSLAIASGTSPLNLTISAAASFGGGTAMTGGNVTLNAANALGSGALALSGGTLVVNADAALAGTVNVTGGTLRVNGSNALAGNPIVLNGGTLDLRANTSATYATGALSVSGTSTLNVANNGSGSSQTLSTPVLQVAGGTVLNLTNSNGFTPNLGGFVLAGDLTLNHASFTVRVQGLSEDASPRRLLKSGTGTLQLEAPGVFSGGTEALAGVLLVKHAGALGSGSLTLGDLGGTLAATAQFDPGLTLSNTLVARSGSSGTLTLSSPGGGVTWSGAMDLQRSLNIENNNAATPSALTGQITGPGALNKTNSGTVTLGNASNNFGSGLSNSLTVTGGTLAAASDGALGNPANGVTIASAITSNSTFLATATFTTARVFTFGGNYGNIDVSGESTLTLSSGFAGTGSFAKRDIGTLEIAAGADSSARGPAATSIIGGTLRLHSPNSLSAAGPITLAGNACTLELSSDADTDFLHPLTVSANAAIHADRAAAGSNGRHALGTLSLASGNLTVTGGNGYGLGFSSVDLKATSSATLTHTAATPLEIATLTSSSGGASRTFTIAGSGDIHVTGAISQSAAGAIHLTKTGPGTLRFGTAVAGFGASTTVRDGTLDLNGLSYSVDAMTLGGAASTLGPRVVTGAAGSLILGGSLTYSSASGAAASLITGAVDLTDSAHAFTINDNPNAAADLTIDGPLGGGAAADLTKSGAGTLRLTGADNTLGGLVSVNGGVVELAKPGGGAILGGGLALTGGTVRLLGNEQIDDVAAVSLDSANEALLELNNFTETTGAVSIVQSDANDYSAVRTGSTGTWILTGGLTLGNNTNTSGNNSRDVLVTGSGTDTSPASDGTLDLGGAVRTVHVTTTTTSQYAPNANATIETRIINGGIHKTGPRTLYLTHPANVLPGGLQIAEGAVALGAAATLGNALVAFGNSGSSSSMLVLSQLNGIVSNDISVGGSGTGTATVSYIGSISGNLNLSGNLSLERDLTLDVATGSTSSGSSAVLNVTGRIADGAATQGLIKTGEGTLKLAPGNTYSGSTTLNRGVLSIAAASALGDGSAPLVFGGGCLHASAAMVLARDVVFTNGGSVRVDTPNGLEVSGNLDWGSGACYLYGSGRTIFSGTSSGTGGDLILGIPGPFAGSWSTVTGFEFGQVLSLRGTVGLPAGNLRIINQAILELGNSDFTRPLGTAAGEVQLDTNTSAGWAAFAANRAVNLGAASSSVTWGQATPPFLYKASNPNRIGDLILGSTTATHTVDFQNPIELNNGATFMTRTLVVPDGPAVLEARVSGNINLIPPPDHIYTELELQIDGALEISGDLTGPFALSKIHPGSATLSGHNTFDAGYYIYEGTVVIAGNDSFGVPDEIQIDEGAHLDAAAMTTPVTTRPNGDIYLYGTLTGSINAAAVLYGYGHVSGDVTIQNDYAIDPDLPMPTPLHVGGALTLESGAFFTATILGTIALEDYGQVRVTGAVNLAGSLVTHIYGALPADFADTLVLILNDGTDPINGTFADLPEGALISLGDGRALRATYHANGDAGSVANDFGFTLVSESAGADLALSVAAPLVTATAAPLNLTYTVVNLSAAPAAAGLFHMSLPGNATFVEAAPSGSVEFGVLTIPLPTIEPGSPTEVSLQFIAPATPAALVFDAWVKITGDPDQSNDSEQSLVAALPEGRLELAAFFRDPISHNLNLSLNTLPGVNYRLENTSDLQLWQTVQDFTGNGETFSISLPVNPTHEFFRFSIVP